MKVLGEVDPRLAGRDCGVHSAFACCMEIGRRDVTIEEMLERVPPNALGVSASDLLGLLQECDVPATPVRLSFEALLRAGAPAILHVDDSHFIAVLGANTGEAIVFDDGVGVMQCNSRWFNNQYRWDGTAILCGKVPTRLEGMFSDPLIGWVCAGLAAGVLIVPIPGRRLPTIRSQWNSGRFFRRDARS